MDQLANLSERTMGAIRNYFLLQVLLVVVLIFTVYWYLNPRIVDFFENPSLSPNPPRVAGRSPKKNAGER
jgi:hypothetical protein